MTGDGDAVVALQRHVGQGAVFQHRDEALVLGIEIAGHQLLEFAEFVFNRHLASAEVFRIQ